MTCAEPRVAPVRMERSAPGAAAASNARPIAVAVSAARTDVTGRAANAPTGQRVIWLVDAHPARPIAKEKNAVTMDVGNPVH